MSMQSRASLLLFGTVSATGGAPTAAAVTASQASLGAYIGAGQNVTVSIYNGDGSNAATFVAQVAPNLGGTAGVNSPPGGATGWYNLYDATTGNLVSWSVGAGDSIAINIPNIASTQIRLTCSANLSACLAVCEVAN